MLNQHHNHREYNMSNKDKEYPAEDVFGKWFTEWDD